MDIKKKFLPNNSNGEPLDSGFEREYIFFKVRFNNFRDVSNSPKHEVIDREEWDECECVLYLPDSYSDTGDETPLVISCHGAGAIVNMEKKQIGGLEYVYDCLDAGYAVMDVNGTAPHGVTMGCPEHIFALHKAYLYAVKNYNLSKQVLVAGASMGGQTAMNFANAFSSIVIAIGLIFPRLNMDGVTIDDHYCIGTWDKVRKWNSGKSTRDFMIDSYHFPGEEWYEPNTIGFNPYKSRSFINSDGERVVMPLCPIKVWQGKDDPTVDPVITTEFVNSVRRGGCYIEYRLMDGVVHSVTPVMSRELVLWFNRFI